MGLFSSWPNVTLEQAKVYQILEDMILKAVFSLVIIVAFCIILYFVLSTKRWELAATYASLDAILAGTMFIAVKHFFPSRDSNNKANDPPVTS